MPNPTDGSAYAIFDGINTLTFFRSENEYINNTAYSEVIDIANNIYTGTVYSNIEILNISSPNDVLWNSWNSSIQTITFASNQIIQPVSTAYWFYNCNNLTIINNIENLDTSNTTNMSGMFIGCRNNSFNPDVSNFDTSNVTDMSGMFSDCGGSSFNPNMLNWDTSNVTNMLNMFNGCQSLTSLNLSSFDTSNVIEMSGMFCDCWNLQTIYVSNKWNVGGVRYSERMFANCYNLIGQDGTTYNSAHIDKAFAYIDEPNIPSYLTNINSIPEPDPEPEPDSGFTPLVNPIKKISQQSSIDGTTYIGKFGADAENIQITLTNEQNGAPILQTTLLDFFKNWKDFKETNAFMYHGDIGTEDMDRLDQQVKFLYRFNINENNLGE